MSDKLCKCLSLDWLDRIKAPSPHKPGRVQQMTDGFAGYFSGVETKEGMEMNTKIKPEAIQNEILKVIAYRDVAVSIGRNLGKRPMSSTSWDHFKADIMNQIDTDEADIHFTGTGLGIYKGKTEESFTITFTTSQEHLERIKKALPGIAKDYMQDSIALTTGRTELIKGE